MYNEYVYLNGSGYVGEKQPRFPWLLLVGLIVLILGTIGICRADVTTAPKENIVQLFSDHMSNGVSTGFILEQGKVVTAKHVYMNTEEKLILVYYDGSKETVYKKNIYTSKKYDLAIIYTKKDKACGLLQLTTKEHMIGTPLYTVGHPLGIRTQISTTGIISSEVVTVQSTNPRFSSWKNVFFSDMYVEPGASGSPVFDEDDNLIGVWVAYTNHYSVIQDKVSIQEFLHAAMKARIK